MTEERMKLIACQTVGEEIGSFLPNNIDVEVLEYGFHNHPEVLHAKLQEAIDHTNPEYTTILIGYGICANGTVGLCSANARLVIPKADDCISLFLGSRQEYLRQLKHAPGTYYLTRGWIECGEDPYTEYCKMRDQYGEEKANRITRQYINNYTRLALINTVNCQSEAYRKYAKMVADRFDLTYEEILGSTVFLEKLVNGDWDDEFVIVPPGEVVRYDMFYENASAL